MKKIIAFMSLSIFVSTAGAAPNTSDNMRTFLLSCGYGTAIGAGAGLLSLAFTENPNSKTNNIARGSSLGLYAGIGYGLYQVYGKKQNAESDDYGFLILPTSKPEDGSLDGAMALVEINSF